MGDRAQRAVQGRASHSQDALPVRGEARARPCAHWALIAPCTVARTQGQEVAGRTGPCTLVLIQAGPCVLPLARATDRKHTTRAEPGTLPIVVVVVVVIALCEMKAVPASGGRHQLWLPALRPSPERPTVLPLGNYLPPPAPLEGVLVKDNSRWSASTIHTEGASATPGHGGRVLSPPDLES